MAVSEQSGHETSTNREIEDWRSSLQFFESAVQYLTAHEAEMALNRGQWNDEWWRTNAELIASATRGADIARRNLARLRSLADSRVSPGD